MKVIIEEENQEKAERLIRCDEAFSLIWNISQKLRDYNKNDTDKTRDEIINELNELITDNNILDLYS